MRETKTDPRGSCVERKLHRWSGNNNVLVVFLGLIVFSMVQASSCTEVFAGGVHNLDDYMGEYESSSSINLITILGWLLPKIFILAIIAGLLFWIWTAFMFGKETFDWFLSLFSDSPKEWPFGGGDKSNKSFVDSNSSIYPLG